MGVFKKLNKYTSLENLRNIFPQLKTHKIDPLLTDHTQGTYFCMTYKLKKINNLNQIAINFSPKSKYELQSLL